MSPLIREKFNLLAQAAGKLGSLQIRQMATIAGNLCNAAPSAETATPLLVLGARAKIVGADGERTVPIEDFFTGVRRTVLKPDEILVELQVPDLPPHSGGVYLRQTVRKALDLAIVGVSTVVTMDGDVLNDVRIALAAIAPTPVRARGAEEILRGKKITGGLLQEAGQRAVGECTRADSIRASAEYRRTIIKVLVVRAIEQAVEQARAV